jgi:hypothetical protein
VLVVGHDLDLHAPLTHLIEGDDVAVVLGNGGQNAVAGLKRDRVEHHVPGAGGVLDHGDLAPVCAEQRCGMVVDGTDSLGRFVLRLVAANLALANGVRYNGINDQLRHQR